jgi:hypothetical protein
LRKQLLILLDNMSMSAGGRAVQRFPRSSGKGLDSP